MGSCASSPRSHDDLPPEPVIAEENHDAGHHYNKPHSCSTISSTTNTRTPRSSITKLSSQISAPQYQQSCVTNNNNNNDRDSNSLVYLDALGDEEDRLLWDEEQQEDPIELGKHLCLGGHRHLDFATSELLLNNKPFPAEDIARYKNTFCNPPSSIFSVRGPHYLDGTTIKANQKALKVPSQDSFYTLIATNAFRAPHRMTHVSQEIGPLRRFFESQAAIDDDAFAGAPRYIVLNWFMDSLTGGSFTVVNHIFKLVGPRYGVDMAFDTAMRDFLNAKDDEGRNNRLKMVFRVADGPAAITRTIQALGGERPVLIGKRLTTTYHITPTHLEVNMDVSSSKVACMTYGVVLANVGKLVMDLAWLLEAKCKAELPERILVNLRWVWNFFEDVILQLDEEGEVVGKLFPEHKS